MNDPKKLDEKVESEEFIPYFTKDYSVVYGSPHYFVFIRCFYTMYERIRLVKKIIIDKVDEEFEENKQQITHHYKNYMKAKNRIRENRGIPLQTDSPDSEMQEGDEAIKNSVVRHRLAILVGITVTRSRSKLDWSTFEDLIRVFLGNKAFFFFTFDKLIQTTNKAFQSILSDEVQKSQSFDMFKKYSLVDTDLRESMYLNDYKINLQAMSSMNGYTCRMLYSPKSKIL